MLKKASQLDFNRIIDQNFVAESVSMDLETHVAADDKIFHYKRCFRISLHKTNPRKIFFLHI